MRFVYEFQNTYEIRENEMAFESAEFIFHLINRYNQTHTQYQQQILFSFNYLKMLFYYLVVSRIWAYNLLFF